MLFWAGFSSSAPGMIVVQIRPVEILGKKLWADSSWVLNQQEKQVFLRKALVITERRNIQFTTGLLGSIANLQ